MAKLLRGILNINLPACYPQHENAVAATRHSHVKSTAGKIPLNNKLSQNPAQIAKKVKQQTRVLLRMFVLLTLVLATAGAGWGQTTIWSEDFTYSDGTTQGSDTPPKWTINTLSNADLWGIYNNQLWGEDIDGLGQWLSESIDISDYEFIGISIDISEGGNQGNDDYIQVQYQIDGGIWTDFQTNGYINNNFDNAVAQQSNLSGSTLKIRILLDNDDNNRSHRADNIIVTGSDSPILNYCASSGNLDYETAITLVDFHTISNSTGKTVGYTDYTSISTNLVQGLSYDLTVSLNTDGDYTVDARVWIDWNKDGDFDDTGEEYILGSTTNNPNGATSNSPLSITAPVGAVLGNTRMRVSAEWDQQGPPTSCETDMDGEVEDYTVNVLPACDVTAFNVTGGGSYCSGSGGVAVGLEDSEPGVNYQLYRDGSPVGSAVSGTGSAISFGNQTAAGTYTVVGHHVSEDCDVDMNGSAEVAILNVPGIATSPSPASGAPGVCYAGEGAVSSISWNEVADATSYDVYFGSGSLPGSVTSNETTNSYNTGTLLASTTYYWKVIPKNSCGETTGTPEEWSFTTKSSPCLSYCTPNFSSGIWPISPVVFEGINNTTCNTVNCDAAYQDYTDQIATVIQGSTYTMNTGGYNNNYPFYYRVYIDWNQNGTLNDAGESYNLGFTTGTTINGAISVPSGATTCSTRMRVMKMYNSYADPCNNGGYGQAEDYTVNVLPACTGTPAPGNTLISTNPVCAGSPYTLSLQNTEPGVTYQWQSSTNGTTWNNVTTSASSTLINTGFSSLPANTNVYGDALVSGDELVLTPATGSQLGGFVIQSTPGSNVTPFSASFNYRIWDGNGADGLSMSYAPDINNNQGTGEEGEGTGIIVKFDTYDNSEAETNSQIRISYGGSEIWTNSIGAFNLRNSNYRTVVVSVDENGYLSLSIGGTSIVSDLFLPGYAAADKTNWKFKFSGRTGGLNDKHSIDNLNIQLGGSSGTGPTYTTSETNSLYYRCLVSCGGNTGTSTPVLVTVSPGIPTADFSVSSATVTAGQSLDFTDNSTNTPTSWLWTFEGGSPGTSVDQNPTGITYNTVGTYDVTLVATNGCGSDTEIKTDHITVTPACTNPTDGGEIAAAQSICSGGDPAAFTSTEAASGHTGTLEYKWQYSTTGPSYSWVDISDSNSETFDDATTLTANRWYRRLARVDCSADWSGAAESNVIQVTVGDQPVAPGLTKSPDEAIVCEGTTLTVTTTPGTGGTGTTADQYRYSTDGGSTWSSWSVTVPDFAAVIGTNLIQSRRTADGPGCNTSDINEVSWTVNPIVSPSVSIAADPGSTICPGSEVTFTATPTNGGTSPSYQWKVDGSNAGSDSPTFITSSLTDEQEVTCEMTSSDPCTNPATATSNTIEMTVLINTVINNHPDDTNKEYCLQATPTDLSVSADGTNLSYQWYTDDDTTPEEGDETAVGSDNNIYTPSTSNPGTSYYYCVVTGVCGTAISDVSGAITVYPESVGGTVSADQTICTGDTPEDLSLSSETGNVVRWQTSSDAAFSSPTDINETGTILSGTSIGVLTATTYVRAVVQSGVCNEEFSDYATITVNELPNNVSGGFTGNTICSGENGELTFNANNSTFVSTYTIQYTDGTTTWSQEITDPGDFTFNVAQNPTSTTNYSLISITNGNGCTRTSGFVDATAQITVESTPIAGTLTKLPDETSICIGTVVSATFSSGSGGNGTDELEYRTNDGTEWTTWSTYTSETEISTTGLSEVQIRTRRLADYCDASEYNTVSWIVNKFNMAVSDATPTPSGEHCPEFGGPFNPDNSDYNPGVTEVIFKVTKEESTTGVWIFDFEIDESDAVEVYDLVSVAGNNSTITYNDDDANGTLDAGNNTEVSFTFWIVNVPGTSLDVEFSVSNGNDGDCDETGSEDDNFKTHVINVMPAVGSFTQ